MGIGDQQWDATICAERNASSCMGQYVANNMGDSCEPPMLIRFP